MVEIEGGVPAGFCTVFGVAGFAVAGAVGAGFAAGVAGFDAGAVGLATGAAGLVAGAAVGAAGLTAGAAPAGRVGVAGLCVAESGTSGGTGACFLVSCASLSSKSIKIFFKSKLRSALGTRRTCLFSAVLGKMGSTAASRLSAASGAETGFTVAVGAVLSARGAEAAGADEGYTLGAGS